MHGASVGMRKARINSCYLPSGAGKDTSYPLNSCYAALRLPISAITIGPQENAPAAALAVRARR